MDFNFRFDPAVCVGEVGRRLEEARDLRHHATHQTNGTQPTRGGGKSERELGVYSVDSVRLAMGYCGVISYNVDSQQRYISVYVSL